MKKDNIESFMMYGIEQLATIKEYMKNELLLFFVFPAVVYSGKVGCDLTDNRYNAIHMLLGISYDIDKKQKDRRSILHSA